jgi:hypothetical protein
VYSGEHFCNIQERNRCLDVSESKDVEGQAVQIHGRTNGANQRWKVVYTNTVKTRTEGMNEKFGFEINRPFYLVSELPFNRVAECHGANNVWLKRWRNNVKAQQWYFDEVSKTIKNNNWRSHSLDI